MPKEKEQILNFMLTKYLHSRISLSVKKENI